MTFFDRNQERINRELEEEKANVEPPAEYSLSITQLGREQRFKMGEPYFSLLNTLESKERHPVAPADLISECKVPFMGKSRIVDALKHLIEKGYIRTEEF